MNALLMVGMGIVVLALGCYATATVTQVKLRRPAASVRAFLASGVACDVTATCFMIAGSRRIPLTFHGVLGYSALALMATDLVLVWRYYRRHGGAQLPAALHRYSLAAFSWWVLAFIAGILVAVRIK